MNNNDIIKQVPPPNAWKVRIGVTMVMLLLAFLGLIITNVHEEMGWNYWRGITLVYAMLCIFMTWYLRKEHNAFTIKNVGREVLHWLGLLATVLLISSFVHRGLINRFGAALTILALLAFSIYLAGIYIEVTFIPVGIILGLFAAFAAFLQQYLYFFLIPLVAIAIAFVFILARKKQESP